MKRKSLIYYAIFLVILIMVEIFNGSSESSNLSTLSKNHDYEGVVAKADVEKLFKNEDYDSLNLVAEANHMIGNKAEALAIIERVLENEDDMHLRATKYDILESMYDYEGMDALVSDTLETYEGFYEQLELDHKLLFSYWLVLDNRSEEAIDKYLELMPDITDESTLDVVYNNLAWAYYLTDKNVSSIIFAKKSLAITPTDPITLNNLGNAYLGEYELEKAEEAYRSSIEYNPYNTDPVYGLATVLEEMNRSEDAIEYWERYIDARPLDEEVWWKIYQYYDASDNLDKRVEALESLMDIDPTYIDYAKPLILGYKAQNKNDLAFSTLMSFGENNDSYTYDLLDACYTFEGISKPDGFDKMIEYMYTYDVSFWDAYYIADILYKDVEGLYFERFLDEVSVLFGEGNRYELEAEIYYDNEAYEDLQEVASALIDYDLNYSYGYELLGDAYFYLEDYQNAQDAYNKALKLGDDTLYVHFSIIDTAIYLDEIDVATQILDSMSEEALDYDEFKILRARLHAIKGDYYAANRILFDVISLSPEKAKVLREYPEFDNEYLKSRFSKYLKYEVK